jgi:hypothetical protein
VSFLPSPQDQKRLTTGEVDLEAVASHRRVNLVTFLVKDAVIASSLIFYLELITPNSSSLFSYYFEVIGTSIPLLYFFK